jgi:Trk-type K+ transport system membrane component
LELAADWIWNTFFPVSSLVYSLRFHPRACQVFSVFVAFTWMLLLNVLTLHQQKIVKIIYTLRQPVPIPFDSKISEMLQ